MTLNQYFKKSKKALKTHLVDSTALMVPSTPLFGAFETFVAGMSVENSIHARALAYGLTYAGMGRLFTKGLDISRNLFKIKPETKERVKQFHDTAYAVTYNLAISPFFYYAAGVRDFKQIAIGTGMAMGVALFIGGPMGYFVDGYRDLMGIKDSKRIPRAVSGQSPRIKKTIAALVLSSSIGLTAGLYQFVPKKDTQTNTYQNNNQSLETKTGVLEK